MACHLKLYPQHDWAGWQFHVKYDICTHAPSLTVFTSLGTRLVDTKIHTFVEEATGGDSRLVADTIGGRTLAV